MRRSKARAGSLALACMAVAGCGVSSKEEIKPRDPTGQGLTRGADVPVESLDELRAVEVEINRGRFQPAQVSIGLDSTVRLVNRGNQTTTIRALEGLANDIDNNELEPGETTEIDFPDPGTERIRLSGGSKAKLEINVQP